MLAQAWLINPRLSWRVAIPILILLALLFLASSRRTGWLLLAAGAVLWLLLNINRIKLGRYKWWMGIAIFCLITLVSHTEVVESRMAEVGDELSRYFAMTPQEPSAAVLGSVSLCAQYVVRVWETIKQNNPWIGVGSIGFPQAYKVSATTLQVTPEAWATYNWGNPHNEYLYMLATKGIVGLMLYLAVFAQACRIAWLKTDELQCIGISIIIYMFILSITTNSMVIDMEEGHFAMFVLSVFLVLRVIYKFGNKS